MDITIYHNARCGTSRNTLALIRNSGVEPQVIDYLANPPGVDALKALIERAGISVVEAVRSKEAAFTELGLAGASDEALLAAMVANPVLINRPLVVTPLGARLCRPSELVLDILPQPQQGPFTKEDGEVVIDANGQRVRHA
jgi:arsenate reductase